MSRLCLVLALVACGSHRAPERAPPPPLARVAPTITKAQMRSAMQSLQYVFGTTGDIDAFIDETDPERAYRRFVAAQVAQDAFYPAVMRPLYMTFRNDMDGDTIPFILQHTRVSGHELYFGHVPLGRMQRLDGFVNDLVRTPCALKDAVEVHPWWDMKHPILVCPDAARSAPDVATHPRCEAVFVWSLRFADSPQAKACGCGPNLVNCVPAPELADNLDHAYQAEVFRTVEDVVVKHQRFATIFTRLDTVRAPLADFFYARSEMLNGRPFVLPDDLMSDAVTARSRPPGFDGGILSTPQLRYGEDARRLQLQELWEDFLCLSAPSSRVQATQIGASPNLRDSTLDHLANETGCKDCHARLESGLRFTGSFMDAKQGFRKLDAPVQRGTIFGARADDVRWEGQATLATLGEQLTAQPEFATCQTQRFAALVYGSAQVPAPTLERLENGFKANGDLAALIADAVVARYVHAEVQGAATDRSTLAALLEQHCGDCHHDGSGLPDLAHADRTMIMKAAALVSSGRMPLWPLRLAPDERTAVLNALCTAGARDVKTCEQALDVDPTDAATLPPAGLVARAAAIAGKPVSEPAATATIGNLGDAYTGLAAPRSDVTVDAESLTLALDVCASDADCIARVMTDPSRWR